MTTLSPLVQAFEPLVNPASKVPVSDWQGFNEGYPDNNRCVELQYSDRANWYLFWCCTFHEEGLGLGDCSCQQAELPGNQGTVELSKCSWRYIDDDRCEA